MAIVTRDSLTAMLNEDSLYNTMHVVGRALVALLNNQTADEREANDTKHSNGVGFTGADARSGTITAKYYLRHKRLEEWQVQMWSIKNNKGVPRLAKYHAQLNAVAEAKAAKENHTAKVRAKTI